MEEATKVTEPEHSVQPVAHGVETILLAEDDEKTRALVRNVLLSSGYTVLESRDVQEALLTCELHPGPIHLLLTDVVMPRMSGTDLAAHASEMRTGIRILYMSGYSENVMVNRDVLANGAFFLQKPFTPDTLRNKLREALDSRVA